MDEREMPILSHLSELRTCIIKSLYGLLASMLLAFFLVEKILFYLRKPMLDILPENSGFVVLSPQEYFFTELKAALFFGVIISAPWLFVQLWRFVAPGLYKHEQKMLFFFVISASFCFLLGIAFAYFLVFPPTFEFFLNSLPEGINGSYSVGMLYGFAITIMLAFGVVFQTPVAVFLLVFFGLVSLETIRGLRRYILVGVFVLGALLTPPDPITQIMLALPTYLLFELGLLLAKLTLNKSKKPN